MKHTKRNRLPRCLRKLDKATSSIISAAEKHIHDLLRLIGIALMLIAYFLPTREGMYKTAFMGLLFIGISLIQKKVNKKAPPVFAAPKAQSERFHIKNIAPTEIKVNGKF